MKKFKPEYKYCLYDTVENKYYSNISFDYARGITKIIYNKNPVQFTMGRLKSELYKLINKKYDLSNFKLITFKIRSDMVKNRINLGSLAEKTKQQIVMDRLSGNI
jgi:hypothetical protein